MDGGDLSSFGTMLKAFRTRRGLTQQQLAEQLGCEIEAVARLALCERPRPVPHFRKDVERIATYIHADMLQLAMLIRAFEAREAFSHQSSATSPTLLAARDHEEPENDDTTDEGPATK